MTVNLREIEKRERRKKRRRREFMNRMEDALDVI